MSGRMCVRCSRGVDVPLHLTPDRASLASILPLCGDCEEVVLRTQLPEVREAIVKVIR